MSGSALVMLVVLGAGVLIARFTRFGTDVYALGGAPNSAALMAVPMRRTTKMARRAPAFRPVFRAPVDLSMVYP